MEKGWAVEFRNVGLSYFPQSRVDCHYSLSSQHNWASSDWIGLFKVGWSSVRDYHTFVWALAPADYQEGTDVNCCVHFQASYLPKPGSQEYEFLYINGRGEVCSQSSKFLFCAPKPLEDLVTLEEAPHGEEGGTDMLLVVPRAELLQTRLQECLRERAELLQVQEAANKQREREKEEHKRLKEAWERRRKKLENDINRLEGELEVRQEKVKELEMKQKEEQALRDALAQENSALLETRESHEKRMTELEEDIKTLTQRTMYQEIELERMKERAKRAAAQRKDEESERKCLQTKLEQTEGELRSLSKEFQSLRSQRDISVFQLQNTIATLTQKLTTAHRKEVESEAVLREMQRLREYLSTSEHTPESLKGDLSTMVTQRDHGLAEFRLPHVCVGKVIKMLPVARTEGRTHGAKERPNLHHIAEVQLSETHRELEGLKVSLRVAQIEKEQLLTEKQEMMEYICQVEQRMGANAKWSAGPTGSTGRLDTPSSDSEDENPEALQPLRPARPLGHYSLCEQSQPDSLLLSTPRELETEAVVISQPAPLSSPRQANADTLALSSDSEEDTDPLQCGRHSYEDETALLLPEHMDTLLSDLADTSLW